MVELTRHARNKCRRYRLAAADVEALLAAPTTAARRPDGTMGAVGTIRDGVYRVVYVVEDDTIVVITLWKEYS